MLLRIFFAILNTEEPLLLNKGSRVSVRYLPADTRRVLYLAELCKFNTGTLPGLLDTHSIRIQSYELRRRLVIPLLEKHCTTKTDIVVDIRWIVVVAVRYSQVVVIVVVPRPATQNTVISVTFLVTQRHAFKKS